MDGMNVPDDATTVLPAVRICAGCGEGFQPRRRGRPGRYCRAACRQRAWALRQAEAELLADGVVLPAPAPRSGADPRSSAARGPVAAQPRAREWVELLGVLEAQLLDPDSALARRPWEHVQVYDALGRALAALADCTPGGLDWLDRNDLRE